MSDDNAPPWDEGTEQLTIATKGQIEGLQARVEDSEELIVLLETEKANWKALAEELEKLKVHCENCGADYIATGLEAGCPCLLIARIKELESMDTSAFCTKHNQMFLPEHENHKWQECPFCRIEELEKALRIAKVTLDAWDTEAITITPEMIDEAWKLLNHSDIPESCKSILYIVLERLHIFRCGGCSGRGKCATHHRGIDWRKCPDCAKFTGKGWVWHE